MVEALKRPRPNSNLLMERAESSTVTLLYSAAVHLVVLTNVVACSEISLPIRTKQKTKQKSEGSQME
jgi:hypothetical protein